MICGTCSINHSLHREQRRTIDYRIFQTRYFKTIMRRRFTIGRIPNIFLDFPKKNISCITRNKGARK